MSSEKTNSKSPGLLRIIALVVLLAGAAGSVAMTLQAGRKNEAVWLVMLFVGWVLSPFIGLLVAHLFSKQWTMLTRVIRYSLMLVITPVSLVAYRGIWDPPGVPPGFKFLITPLVSWLLIAIILIVTLMLSRRFPKQGDST